MRVLLVEDDDGVAGEEVALTNGEFAAPVGRRGTVVGRRQLVDEVRGDAYLAASRTPARPGVPTTIRGSGYRSSADA